MLPAASLSDPLAGTAHDIDNAPMEIIGFAGRKRYNRGREG